MNILRFALFRLGYIGAMFLSTAIVAMLWYLGQFGGLFDNIPQYDKLLHFLGGFTCGIFGAFVIAYGPFDPLRSLESHHRLLMTSALMSAFAIGGAWEIMEYVVPSMQDPLGWSFWDTFFDLCFDLLGSAVAARMYQRENCSVCVEKSRSA